MKQTPRTFLRAGAISVAAVAMLLAGAPVASAASQEVCNAAFCNTTIGSDGTVSEVIGTKIGDNQDVTGFFEVFGPGGLKETGETTSENETKFNVNLTLNSGEFMCLRFFAEFFSETTGTGGQFVEVGTAQCTKAPY